MKRILLILSFFAFAKNYCAEIPKKIIKCKIIAPWDISENPSAEIKTIKVRPNHKISDIIDLINRLNKENKSSDFTQSHFSHFSHFCNDFTITKLVIVKDKNRQELDPNKTIKKSGLWDYVDSDYEIEAI